ncbi:hypothetical protein [Flavobacterium sp.]|uniref:hypothetical protein n=1 Tax=Flavobacterium sp. TaxID=239 RepID=UPI003D0E52F6
MNQESESHFDEFDKPPIIRRKLLPWWIKIFCWVFMILALCAVGAIIMNLFTPNVNISIYGFSSNTVFSGIGIFIIAIIVLKGLLLILFGLKNLMQSQLVKLMPYAES